MSVQPIDGEAIAASLADPRAFGVIFEWHFGAIPETSAILGDRWVVVKPGVSPSTDGLPAGLVIRETAAIRSGLVDSVHARPEAAAKGW
jgi:hypothetical protein